MTPFGVKKLLEDPAFKKWPPAWRAALFLAMAGGFILGAMSRPAHFAFVLMGAGFLLIVLLKTLADLLGFGEK